ncbi:MAG: hypothetical protein KGL35_10630 [Bradyrhizobium sp.]|nr:hypothetical protein [Bradyrhizobium sp.]
MNTDKPMTLDELKDDMAQHAVTGRSPTQFTMRKWRAAIEAHLASASAEAVGTLVVEPDNTNQYGKNAHVVLHDECMYCTIGRHALYTHPAQDARDEWRRELLHQSRRVRNYSNPDDTFEAVPTRFVESLDEAQKTPPCATEENHD